MAVSIIEVLITGNSTPLTAALTQGGVSVKVFENSVAKSASKTQSALGSIGKAGQSALGKFVPLGAAAAGLAVAAFAKQSFDAAVSFDRSFTQIAALTNTTSKQLGVMKQSVLDLAGETAQAPTELAQAAYFLASAGLSASQQMETLEASAKGAAVGLGAAGDIARITANALNVFADNGLKAADVTDTLVAAVREGSAEPDEFAGALGRVLPIADKAGISFQQVAASLATMSNAGLDVNEGVTALRGTLQALVSPTTQTQDALAGIGLTVDDVVDSLQQNGLIATLRMLDTEARKNTDTTGEYNIVMRELVPNVRALTGVFNLTGQEARKVDKIFREVAGSTGDLDKAFQTTAESDAFKLKQALNDISIEGQTLAAEVLPSVATGLGFVADHVKGLMQILAGFAALRFGIRLASQLEDASGALGALGRSARLAKTNMAGLTTVAASVLFLFTTVKGIWDDAHISLDGLSKEFGVSTDVIAKWRDQMSLSGAFHEGRKSIDGFIAGIGGISDNLQELGEKIQPTAAELNKLGLGAGGVSRYFNAFQYQLDGSSESIDQFVAGAEGGIKLIRDLTSDFLKGQINFREFASAMKGFGLESEDAFYIASRAADSHGRTLKRTGETVRNFLGMTSDELATWSGEVSDAFAEVTSVADVTQGNFADDLHKMAEAARLMNQDMSKLAKADWVPDQFIKFLVDQGPAAVHDFANANRREQGTMISDWRAYEKAFGGTMDALTRAIKNLTHAINGVPKTHNTNFTSNADAAKGDIQSLGSSIKALDTSVVFDIKLHTHPASPWPDEALKMHLTDPLRRTGFKRIGDRYTLPLDVATHSAFDPITPPGARDGSSGGSLRRLTHIEADSRDFLKDIRGVLRHMDGIGGGGGAGGGVTGSVGGGGGTTGSVGAPLDDAIHRVEKLLDKSGATTKETMGVIRRVAQQGPDSGFIKKSIAMVADELGKGTAKLYGRALRKLDDATLHSDAKRAALIKAALEQMREPMRQAPTLEERLAFPMKNIPSLPRGHTLIDPNIHTRDEPWNRRRRDMPVRVLLERRHFDRQMSYEESYRGFD